MEESKYRPNDERNDESIDRLAKRFDWEKYREIADAHCDGARKVGLIDKTSAEESTKDPRTVSIEVEGMDFPAIVPIEYAEGYDPQRTREFVGNTGGNSSEVYYYCVPPDLIDESQMEQIAELIKNQNSDDFFVYFDYDAKKQRVKEQFEAVISKLGRQISSIPLYDPQVSERNQQASIGLYATSAHRTEVAKKIGGSNLSIFGEFQKALKSGEYEKFPENGTTLLKGSEIDNDLRDKMWNIYLGRFQDLGEYHPITMEDTREGFENLIDDPSTTCSITFKDADPVCWMCFCTSVDECEWLNQNFFDEGNLHMSSDEELLFFPEIVARADTIGFAKPTLQLATEIASRTGRDYKVVFESTNRSAGYIPRMVKMYIEETGKLSATKPEEIDKTLYACYMVAG
jgi:hypothetical protein